MANTSLQYLYVTEFSAGRVLRLTVGVPNEMQVVISGLNEPYGVTVDVDGTLFVSEQGRAQRVTRWPPNSLGSGGGPCELVAGGNGQGSGEGQLNCPAGLALDCRGGLLIADQYNDRILRWEGGEASIEIVAGGGGPGMSQLDTPTGVAVDEQGALLVAEYGSNQITRWSLGAKSGVLLADFGRQLRGPCLLAASSRELVVADRKNHRALLWEPACGDVGAVVTTIAGGNGQGAGADQLNCPSAIVICHEDHVIADTDNGRIVQWTPGAATAWCTLAEGLAAPLGLAVFNPPIMAVTLRLALDADGAVAVSCTALGGDSLAVIRVEPGQNVAWLRAAIAAQLCLNPRQLRLISAGGQLVGAEELVSDLDTEGAVAAEGAQ